MIVLLTQPYLAAYRVGLFEEIAVLMAERGHQWHVIGGNPKGEHAHRRDATTASWYKPTRVVSVGWGRFAVSLRVVPRPLMSSSVTVTELDIKNLNAWAGVLLRPQRTVLWGHGKPYVTNPGKLAEALKGWLVRRARRVLTYSQGGADYVESLGVPPDRVVAIGNSTDTGKIRAELAQCGESEPTEGLAGRNCVLFVGGLDASKDIQFLLECAVQALALDPTFLLLVAGDGVDRHLVNEAEEQSDAVRYVGKLDEKGLATLGACARAIWMPGRVGLVAVDALALGLPVHTVSSPDHAPELEFLQEPAEVAFLAHEPRRFAEASLASLGLTMHEGRRLREDIPSLAKVASSFVDAVAGEL